jgi:hypothetical protein
MSAALPCVQTVRYECRGCIGRCDLFVGVRRLAKHGCRRTAAAMIQFQLDYEESDSRAVGIGGHSVLRRESNCRAEPYPGRYSCFLSRLAALSMRGRTAARGNDSFHVFTMCYCLLPLRARVFARSCFAPLLGNICRPAF